MSTYSTLVNTNSLSKPTKDWRCWSNNNDSQYPNSSNNNIQI